MWQGMELRKFPRADYRCKVAVLKKGKKEELGARTQNIGIGGVCVILKKELDKFSDVKLILYLENSHAPLECEGRIMWVVRSQDEFDTGIEFTNIKEDDLARIEKVVVECLKAQGNSQTSS
jgi:hypothetical protein